MREKYSFAYVIFCLSLSTKKKNIFRRFEDKQKYLDDGQEKNQMMMESSATSLREGR